MRLALALGRRNLGYTWPNPSVGAVIVKDGVILGRGWTHQGGRPHAEVEALRRAKKAAQGATMSRRRDWQVEIQMRDNSDLINRLF